MVMGVLFILNTYFGLNTSWDFSGNRRYDYRLSDYAGPRLGCA